MSYVVWYRPLSESAQLSISPSVTSTWVQDSPAAFPYEGKFKESCLVKGPFSSPLILNRLVHYFGHHQPTHHTAHHIDLLPSDSHVLGPAYRTFPLSIQLLKWEELNWMQVENVERNRLINSEAKVEFLVLWTFLFLYLNSPLQMKICWKMVFSSFC